MRSIFSILIIFVFTNLLSAQDSKKELQEQFVGLIRAEPSKALEFIDSISISSEPQIFSKSELELLKAKSLSAMSQYPRARMQYEVALNTAQFADDSAYQTKSLLGIAITNYKLSNLESAIRSAKQALEYAERLNDTESEASALTLIGNVMLNQQDFEVSLDYFTRALELQKARNDSSQMAGSLNNIGNVFLRQKDFDEAEEYFKKTLWLDSALGSTANVAGDYNNLGLVFKNRGEIDKAMEMQKASLEINRRLKLSFGICGNLNNLGNLYEKNGQLERAESLFKECLSITDSLGYSSIYRDALANLADLYSVQGRYNESIELYKDLALRLSATYNEDVAKSLTSFNDYYELMQKDAEIQLLEQKEELREVQMERQRLFYLAIVLLLVTLGLIVVWWMRVRRIKERHSLELQLQNHQLKALQLQMNPHFLFNTLGAIGTFISSNEQDEAVKYLSKFSRLMRNILDGSRSSSTTLARETSMLRRYLELESLRSDDQFEFSIECPVELEQAIIPTMITQPFVENAVIHGVRRTDQKKGKIEVKFYLLQGQIKCDVHDNGLGFSDETFENQKNQTHQSVGMDSIRSRLDLLSKMNGNQLGFEVKTSAKLGGALVEITLGDSNKP